jgi:uncharacterized membrane protein
MAIDPPRSTAKVAGHPIHPMLVPFPIALLVAAFLCDVAFWRTHGDSWAIAAMWLLGAGLVTAALAAVAGLIDFAGDSRIRSLRDAWLHMIGNVVAVVLTLVSFVMRWRYGAAAVLPWGLWLSLIVFGLLLFNGWKGGELVFRHHVGMVDETQRRAVTGGVETEEFHPGRPSASHGE